MDIVGGKAREFQKLFNVQRERKKHFFYIYARFPGAPWQRSTVPDAIPSDRRSEGESTDVAGYCCAMNKQKSELPLAELWYFRSKHFFVPEGQQPLTQHSLICFVG